MKNNIKRIIPAVALTAAIAATATMAYAEYNPDKISDNTVVTTKTVSESNSVTINDNLISGVTKTFENHLFVPVRAIAEELGFSVEWIADTKTITLTNTPQYITFNINSDGYTFARTAPIKLGYAPVLTEGVTYVPVEFLTEIMHLDVETLNNSITITTDNKSDDITDSEQDPIIGSATVTSVEDGRISVNDEKLGEVVLIISEDTTIKSEDEKELTIEDITEGAQLTIEYNEAMTMSLPPINNPISITVLNASEEEKIDTITMNGTISEIILPEKGQDVSEVQTMVVIKSTDKASDDNEYQELALLLSDDTEITFTGEADTLTVGAEITAEFSPVMTRSIPAQTQCFSITVK